MATRGFGRVSRPVPPLSADGLVGDIARLHGLTPQEVRILERAADGRASKEVAFDLQISRRTVDYYWSRIFAKLGCRSQLEVMALMLSEAAKRLDLPALGDAGPGMDPARRRSP